MSKQKQFIVVTASIGADFIELEELLNSGYRVVHTASLEYGGDSGLVYILEKNRIESVKSVDLNEVDAWLQKGYEVQELYAKTATLVKKAEA